MSELSLTARDAELASLAELLDLAPVGVIVRTFDADTISYWSRGAEELYGWSRDEALGQVTHDLLRTVFPVSKEDVDETLTRAGRWEGELIHTRRDGEPVVVASRQAVQRDADGRLRTTLEINADITHRKHVQDGLRESEDRFRLLVESVQDYAIFLLSPEGRVASWNIGAQRVMGYTRDEIIGQPSARLYSPEDVARGLPDQLLARATSEGRAHAEGWRIRKDGSRFWANVVLSALRDDSGELRGFAKVTHDLTERKQAEETRADASRKDGARVASEAAQVELRASRDQLAAILAGVAEGITVQDVTGRIVYANDAAARLCGFSDVEEMLDVASPQILQRFAIFDEAGEPVQPEQLPGRQALHGLPVPEMLVRFRVLATGEERWSLIIATPILDSQGRAQLSVSIFRDITERRRAEEVARFMAAASAELATSLDFETTLERLAQLAVPALADWCVVDVLDDDGRLRRLAATHIDPAKAQLAREVSERYPDDPSSPGGVAATMRSGKPVLLATITDEQLRDGARDAEHLAILRSLMLRSIIVAPLVARGRTLGAISLVAAESGRVYGQRDLDVANDLAVRAALAVDNARLYREAQHQAATLAELNTALHDTMAQLRQSQSTRDEFLAAASHDLKNPVSSIKASAQLLQRRLARTGTVEAEQLTLGLERIDAIATRAAGLVDELLDVARVQMGRPLDLDRQPVELVALAREIAAEHQQRSDRHPIELVAPLAEIVGEWDRRRLERVLGNLLDNAIKYSPAGGAIRVSVGLEPENRGWVVLSVEDQGIGIPDDELDKIFERFQRGTNAVGQIAGSGIGLASARHIVQNHGGTLTASSQPAGGSIFTIRLPIDTDSDANGEGTAGG